MLWLFWELYKGLVSVHLNPRCSWEKAYVGDLWTAENKKSCSACCCARGTMVQQTDTQRSKR